MVKLKKETLFIIEEVNIFYNEDREKQLIKNPKFISLEDLNVGSMQELFVSFNETKENVKILFDSQESWELPQKMPCEGQNAKTYIHKVRDYFELYMLLRNSKTMYNNRAWILAEEIKLELI